MINRFTTFAVVFISLISLSTLSGCTKSVAGTYDLDKAAVKAAAEAEIKKKRESDPNDPMAMGASMMAGVIDSMTFTLTLNADGTASMLTGAMGQSSTGTGTYTVSGSTITLTMAEPGQESDTVTGTVKGDTITLDPPKDQQMPFDLVFKKRKV